MSWSSSSSSSKSSSSKKKDPKNQLLLHEPFPEAIKQCEELKCILHAPMEYEIFLDSSGYHWYLLVKPKMEGATFPYATLEITTMKAFGGEMIPTMRIISDNPSDETSFFSDLWSAYKRILLQGGIGDTMLLFGGKKWETKGTRETTLMELCKIAEKV